MKKGIRFEITTFRKEISYLDNRHPSEIQYIDDLYQDLLRRDFTINTICMDEEGEIIDFLGGRCDIDARIIRTVGVAKDRFYEDCLRILRAIRFATVLHFQLDSDVVDAIGECRGLLKKLSYQRKREELDKIFASPYVKEGISLLLDLGLDKDLELSTLKQVTCPVSLIGVWSILNVCDKYPFSSNEKELIQKVQQALSLNNLDPMALYQYGLYVNCVAGEIKGISKKKITEAYKNLLLYSRKDLKVDTEDILSVLQKDEPGAYLKDIYCDLEREVLYRRLPNQKDFLLSYIKKHYS